MSIHLHIEANNAGDLLAQLAELAQNMARVTGAPIEQLTADEVAPAETTPKRTRKTAEQKVSTPEPAAETVSEGNESAATADAADSTSEASAPDAAAEGLTYADVRAVMLKLTTAKSRDAAIELLADFKVAKAQDLSEDQYEAFIAAAKAAAEA